MSLSKLITDRRSVTGFSVCQNSQLAVFSSKIRDLTFRSPDTDLEAILEIIDTAAQRRRVVTTERIGEALRQLDQVHRHLQKSLRGTLALGQTNFVVKGDIGTNTLFWFKPGSNETMISTTYDAREVGDETIVRMSGETVFRTPITSPNYGDQFQLAVRAWVLARIREAVSDPNMLPPESETFREIKPLACLANGAEVRFFYLPIQVLPNSIWG
jgi:hypothetical protein